MQGIQSTWTIIIDWYKVFKTLLFNKITPYIGCMSQFDMFDVLFLYTLIIILAYNIYISFLKKQPYEDRNLITRLYKKVLRSILNFQLIQTYINKKAAPVLQSFDHEISKSAQKKIFKIPDNGMTLEKIQERLEEFKDRDMKTCRTNKISGSVYVSSDKKYEEGVMEFSKHFIYSNPMHFDQWPATRQMEAEVIRMTGDLFGYEKEPFGILTSGGTESILLSILAYRNWARETKGITEPNLVLPETAHVAFLRACSYFMIEARIADVDPKTYKADIKKMKQLIDSNTIALVASAPNFGPGIIDPIDQISELAFKKKIGCHIDACLGGFIIAFHKDKFPKFDFTLRGVTSISCDNHKYGMSPKGASTLLFRSKQLRQYCMYACSSWSGGYYAVPTLAGSRGGVAVSGAWYSLVANGKKKYTDMAQIIIDSTVNLANEIRKIPELDVLGNPQTCVVAFQSKVKQINIYSVHQLLTSKGWNISTVQKPSAIHLSITSQNQINQKLFIKDLKDSIDEVKQNPSKYKGGTQGAIYGTSQQVPDTKLLDDIMTKLLDYVLKI